MQIRILERWELRLQALIGYGYPDMRKIPQNHKWSGESAVISIFFILSVILLNEMSKNIWGDLFVSFVVI